MVVTPAVLLGVSQAPQRFQHGEVVELLSACSWDDVGEARATGSTLVTQADEERVRVGVEHLGDELDARALDEVAHVDDLVPLSRFRRVDADDPEHAILDDLHVLFCLLRARVQGDAAVAVVAEHQALEY